MSDTAEIAALYSQVTEAIERAEACEDQGAHFAVSAEHRRVSLLEEAIAKELPASTAQGAIARCGAVYSAFRGNQFARVRALASEYLADAALSEADRSEIKRFDRLAAHALTTFRSQARR